MPIYQVTTEDCIRLHGRRNRRDTRPFFAMDWSGSGLEFSFVGTYARIELEARHGDREQWVIFEVDHIPHARMRLIEGRHWYTLIDDRSTSHKEPELSNARRTAAVYKESQADIGKTDATTLAYAIETDGPLNKLPKRKRVECIGDSLACGEGAISPTLEAIGSGVSIDAWCSAYYSWSGFLARELDFDRQLICQGGWGIYCAWDNDITHAIPSIYDRVCGVVRPEHGAVRGTDEPYDFSFDADAVVINLGTNDAAAFSSPPWCDERTGRTYKLRRENEKKVLDAKIYIREDEDKVTQAAATFLEKIAAFYPRAVIVWTYGMMASQMWPAIDRAIDQVAKKIGRQIRAVCLPATPQTILGANWHPLAEAHENCAKLIAKVLKDKL